MAEQSAPSVTVGVCTYRRPELLHRALDSLARQTWPHRDFQIVVVDNDSALSARPVVQRLQAESPHLTVVYAHESGRGVSHVRNRAVAMSTTSLVAFLDDDEEADPSWLEELLLAQRMYRADIVLGPVYSLLGADSPRWLRVVAGRVPDGGLQTGSPVPAGSGGCGNSLFCRETLLARGVQPFLPALSLTGGEDADLFEWVRSRGGRIVWCAAARASEHVPPQRRRLGFYLGRHFCFATVYWRAQYRRSSLWAASLNAAFGATAGVACLFVGGVTFLVRPHIGAPLLMTGMRGLGRLLALTAIDPAVYGR